MTKDFTTVQFKCSNCTVWSRGKLDIQSAAANFIYAYGTGAPTNPSSPSSGFPQHAEHGNFQLNLKLAQTASNAAPQISGQAKPANGGKTGGLSERQWVLLTSNSH